MMDIAALATVNSQVNISNQAGILLMRKVMDTSIDQNQGLLQLMSATASSISPPNLGNNIDISI